MLIARTVCVETVEQVGDLLIAQVFTECGRHASLQRSWCDATFIPTKYFIDCGAQSSGFEQVGNEKRQRK